MLIDLKKSIQKHRMKITGVIHVGAHYGEEYFTYLRFAKGPVVFVEPAQSAFDILALKAKDWPNVELFKCACGREQKVMTMNVERRNNGQSNSLLKPMKHLDHYPDIQFMDTEEVEVIPLDLLKIDKKRFNFLNMDVQGYELEVLKGATETLKHIKYIYTEVNRDELYEHCARVEQLDLFLKPHGFKRVETKWTNQSWGDAIYTR
jgi:FkbM family methyltransferase